MSDVPEQLARDMLERIVHDVDLLSCDTVELASLIADNAKLRSAILEACDLAAELWNDHCCDAADAKLTEWRALAEKP